MVKSQPNQIQMLIPCSFIIKQKIDSSLEDDNASSSSLHKKQWWQGANIDGVHKTTSTHNDKEIYELAQINKKIKT
jgi:hypothetical protein